MTNELLNAEQAADYLSISKRTLANWRSKGFPQVDYVKVGGCVRYRRTSLEKFLNTRTVNSGGA